MAAGTVSVEDPDGPLRSPVILDLVVDLAAPVPRIASLRDISSLEIGVRLHEGRASAGFDDPTREAGIDAVDGVPFGGPEAEDGLFGREGFVGSFESVFYDRESVFDDESAFDDRESFFDDESTFPEEGAGSDDPGLEEPSGIGDDPGGGPTGRWSPR